MTLTLPDITIEHDVGYGPDRAHRLDLYHPPGNPQATLLDIHGGGWWTGDKSHENALAMALAQAGFLVAAVNYRLAADGANTFPTAVDDCSRAIDWLDESPLPCRRHRMAAIGASSGGNLAVEMAVRHAMPAVSWSGLLDLEGFVRSHPDIQPHLRTPRQDAAGLIDQGGPDPGYYLWLVRNLLGGDMTRLAQATPLNRIDANTGPLFLAGSLEELVPAEEPLKAAAAATRHGVPNRVLMLEGSRHGQAYMDAAMACTLEFLRHYLDG